MVVSTSDVISLNSRDHECGIIPFLFDVWRACRYDNGPCGVFIATQLARQVSAAKCWKHRCLSSQGAMYRGKQDRA